MLYEEGIEIARNYEEAVKFYQNAADKGHENALYHLAQLHHYGNGVKRDYIKAFDLYTLASKYGHRLAELSIKITNNLNWQRVKDSVGDSYKDSVLDYDTCLKMWGDVANNGAPDLQYQLGQVYEEMGSDYNLVQAKKWYSKAAEYSHGPSLFRSGRLFEFGLGDNQGYKKAIMLYDQSSMTGTNDALCALTNIYQHRNGVKLDLSKAFGYYKSAAENGDKRAQFILGTLHEKGGIEHGDLIEAFKWLSIAASQGNEEARSYLETNYENSSSSGQFNVKSFQYLSKLITLEGNTNRLEHSFFGEVYYRLSLMYYYDYGTSINYEKAWEYFQASSSKYGETRATTFLNIGFEGPNSSTTADFLKKLEILESVAKHLKKKISTN